MSEELIERPNSTKDLVERPNSTKLGGRCREDIIDENVGRLVYTIADTANLVAAAVAAEREACALVCETIPAAWPRMDDEEICMECAKAIRARGGE